MMQASNSVVANARGFDPGSSFRYYWTQMFSDTQSLPADSSCLSSSLISENAAGNINASKNVCED